MIDAMDAKTRKLYEAALISRSQYRIGAINRNETVGVVSRYISHANIKAKKIAKRFGATFKSISVWGFLR